MNLSSELLVVSPNAALSASVTGVLKSEGHALARPAMRDLRELQLHLASGANGGGGGPIVLVDIDVDGRRALQDM